MLGLVHPCREVHYLIHFAQRLAPVRISADLADGDALGGAVGCGPAAAYRCAHGVAGRRQRGTENTADESIGTGHQYASHEAEEARAIAAMLNLSCRCVTIA